MTVFNFDEWKDLYKTDPAAFEAKRKQATKELIDSAPAEHQLKLMQTQWKLDAIHQTTNPVQGMVKMQQLMFDSVVDMRDSMIDLKDGLVNFQEKLEDLNNVHHMKVKPTLRLVHSR